jgi:hypothetical protein
MTDRVDALFAEWSQEPDTFQAIEVVSPTPEQLADYAGDYYSDELQVTYKLVLEDGKLYARHCPGRVSTGHRNAPPDPLKPGLCDVLRLPIATLDFVRNDKGVVSGFALNAGRVRNVRFVKKE